MKFPFSRLNSSKIWCLFSTFFVVLRPKKINVVFPVTGPKLFGSVGRDFILFYFFKVEAL